MSVDEAIEEFDFFNEGDYITRKMEEAKDIVLKELKELQEVKSDLYEANNIISDLLDIAKQKDKIIDLMAKTIDNYDSQLEINYFKDVEHIKQYFKEYAEEEV